MQGEMEALCERCWLEEHVETPCRWEVGTPRWCQRHYDEFYCQLRRWKQTEADEVANNSRDEKTPTSGENR